MVSIAVFLPSLPSQHEYTHSLGLIQMHKNAYAIPSSFRYEYLNRNILDVELNAMILAASHTDRPHLVERLQHLRTSWQVSWDWSGEVT